MKSFLQAGPILAVLALSMAGCDHAEPKHEPAVKAEVPVAGPGPAADPGPIEPSTAVSLPPTNKVEEKAAEPKAEPPKP